MVATCTWGVVNKEGMLCVEVCTQSSLCPYRFCGWVWAGDTSPGLGDPGRPGNSRPARWGHPVEKTATKKRGEVSERPSGSR